MNDTGNGKVQLFSKRLGYAAVARPDTDRMLESMGAMLVACQVQAGATACSWDDRDEWGPMGGRVYSTAMAAMSLKRN